MSVGFQETIQEHKYYKKRYKSRNSNIENRFKTIKMVDNDRVLSEKLGAALLNMRGIRQEKGTRNHLT